MFNKTQPYRVTALNGKTHLVIMNATDGLPAAFALMGTRALDKVAIRLTGGCKGMSVEDKAEMIEFFSFALAGYQGILWSGGTRQTDKSGEVDPMVTDIPGIIAAQNVGCVALGTIPRTDMLTLQEDSRLVLDQWGTVPNPDMLGILIVQNGPDGEMGWDGDLDVYFRLMQNWQTYAGFTTVGLISWNGGDVTREEIMRSIKLGWPTILIKGSGRVTDEIADKILNQDKELEESLPKNACVLIISKEQPELLRSAIVNLGFLKE